MFAVPFVLFGWLATLAAVGLVSDEAPAQVVMFPSDAFLQNLPSDVSIVSSDRWSVTLASRQASFAKSLYSLGAVIVLPSGLQGCAPPSSA